MLKNFTMYKTSKCSALIDLRPGPTQNVYALLIDPSLGPLSEKDFMIDVHLFSSLEEFLSPTFTEGFIPYLPTVVIIRDQAEFKQLISLCTIAGVLAVSVWCQLGGCKVRISVDHPVLRGCGRNVFRLSGLDKSNIDEALITIFSSWKQHVIDIRSSRPGAFENSSDFDKLAVSILKRWNAGIDLLFELDPTRGLILLPVFSVPLNLSDSIIIRRTIKFISNEE